MEKLNDQDITNLDAVLTMARQSVISDVEKLSQVINFGIGFRAKVVAAKEEQEKENSNHADATAESI